MNEKKKSKKKPIHHDETTYNTIAKRAKESGRTLAEEAAHLVNVAINRINALAKYKGKEVAGDE